jgi:rhodanese-related sulfurtransferase
MPNVGRRSYFIDAAWQIAAILFLSVALSLAVNHLRKDGLPLVGDWSQKAQLSAVKTIEEPVVSIQEARALFLTQGAVFVDARPAASYAAGHIQGAINLPTEDLDSFFARAMAEVQPDTLLIVYCDGESCTLSKEVAEDLTGRGYPHVRVLVNGWTIWQDAKLPTATGFN